VPNRLSGPSLDIRRSITIKDSIRCISLPTFLANQAGRVIPRVPFNSRNDNRMPSMRKKGMKIVYINGKEIKMNILKFIYLLVCGDFAKADFVFDTRGEKLSGIYETRADWKC
jgi:hypothetical protein